MKKHSSLTLKAIYFKEFAFIPHILKEIYIDMVYDKYLRNKKDLVILDLGAHVGMFSMYAAYYAKQIYAVEPSMVHFDALKALVIHNKLPVKVINAAISNVNKKRPLFHIDPKGDEFQPTAYNLMGGSMEGAEMVDCITMDKLFKDHKIEQVDFCKMDIEGSEFEVIAGEGFRKVADKIKIIFGELHYFAGRNHNQIKQALDSYGFETKFIINGKEVNEIDYDADKNSTWGENALMFVGRKL